MRSLGHRLLSARDDDLGVAVGDLLQPDRHRAQAAATQLIEAERGLLLRNARFHRRLPRRILAFPRLQYLPQDDLVDLPGLQFRRRQSGLDRGRPQFVSRRIGEGAVEGSDRGALGAGDDDFRCRHGVLRKSKLATTVAVALGSALTSTRSPRSRHWSLDRERAARSKPGDRFARFPRLPTAALQCNKSIPRTEKRLSCRLPSGRFPAELVRHVEFNVADHHQEVCESASL